MRAKYGIVLPIASVDIRCRQQLLPTLGRGFSPDSVPAKLGGLQSSLP